MYLYYDKNFHLQEVINDVQLHAYDTSNKIYIYFEKYPLINTEGQPYYVDSEGVTHTITVLQLTLSAISGAGETISVQLSPLTTASTSQIPYVATRDLRYFSYYMDYVFFVFDLNLDSNNELVLQNTGLNFGNPYITVSDGTTTTIEVADKLTFTVADTAITAESFVTQSQYAYLLDLYKGIYTPQYMHFISATNVLQLETASGVPFTSVILPFANYLPISGGTTTGNISVTGSVAGRSMTISPTALTYVAGTNQTPVVMTFASSGIFASREWANSQFGGLTTANAWSNTNNFNGISNLKETNIDGTLTVYNNASFSSNTYHTTFALAPFVNGYPVVTTASFESTFNSSVTATDINTILGATYVQNATYATSAGKATNDGAGATITTTYLKVANFTASTIISTLGTTPVNRATADGNGNNIVNTYLAKTGFTASTIASTLGATYVQNASHATIADGSSSTGFNFSGSQASYNIAPLSGVKSYHGIIEVTGSDSDTTILNFFGETATFTVGIGGTMLFIIDYSASSATAVVQLLAYKGQTATTKIIDTITTTSGYALYIPSISSGQNGVYANLQVTN